MRCSSSESPSHPSSAAPPGTSVQALRRARVASNPCGTSESLTVAFAARENRNTRSGPVADEPPAPLHHDAKRSPTPAVDIDSVLPATSIGAEAQAAAWVDRSCKEYTRLKRPRASADSPSTALKEVPGGTTSSIA